MLVNAKKILEKAQKGKYAIGHFNTNNLETTQAIIEAASEMKAPIFLATSEKAFEYAGFDNLVGLIKIMAQEVKTPIILHLDHGASLAIVEKCIRAGFTSVMMDASKKPFSENIRLTKKVVQLAKAKNVSVESELGALAGREDYVVSLKSVMTDPKKAAEFVKKTGVDSLAVSIGNIHGIPLPYERLDFARLNEIRKNVKIPLVLHGASSTAPAKIRQAIKLGICKINIDTDLRLAFTNTLRKTLAKDKKVYDPRAVLMPSREALKRVVIEKIKLFGNKNKA